ncbi:MAG TPA: MarR family transcriptional regulator [Acidobacteriaceae bacterium]|nr:MarR family transcriptional regulator [Acidobacteriaceae bacterium]
MLSSSTPSESEQSLYRSLAEFRHQLRLFLAASEEAAHKAGLQPQQHQLLLALAGAPAEQIPSIGFAAERLGLKHNTVVELVDRSQAEGLLRRRHDPQDRRRVRLEVTAHGRKVLTRLSQVHLQELGSRAPHLINALQNVLQPDSGRSNLQEDCQPVAGQAR